MLKEILTITFFGSLFGMLIIIFRKIPILLTLPEVEIEPKEKVFSKLKKRFLKINYFRDFSLEVFLEKILRRMRILTLKTDNKIFSWLTKLKEKIKKKEFVKNDNYWEEIKKEIKNKIYLKNCQRKTRGTK
jgi:hypothetical protein